MTKSQSPKSDQILMPSRGSCMDKVLWPGSPYSFLPLSINSSTSKSVPSDLRGWDRLYGRRWSLISPGPEPWMDLKVKTSTLNWAQNCSSSWCGYQSNGTAKLYNRPQPHSWQNSALLAVFEQFTKAAPRRVHCSNLRVTETQVTMAGSI